MGPAALVHQLVNAGELEVSDAERSTRGRVAAETAVDLLDVVRIASVVLPASPIDALRAERDPEAADRLRARGVLDGLRAELADLSGAMGRPFIAGDASTGLGAALPIVRGVATELPTNALPGARPVLPSVTGGDVDGMIDPATPLPDDETSKFTVTDTGPDVRWHNGACAAIVARQVFDHTDATGSAMLDQAFLDIADTAAERGMVEVLEEGAGGTRAAGADLPGALDDAEAEAGTAGRGAAALVIVAPSDWPRVRRAVAASWQQAPAPRVAVSSGATAGTVTVLGPSAAHLLTRPVVSAYTRTPRMVDELYVLRPFLVAIRAAGAVQTVTL